MTSPASDSMKEIIARLDARIRRVDEERWLSSRYAGEDHRKTLIVLYAFYYELARVRLAVTDQTMGQIRFQWWRDALTGLEAGDVREHDLVLALVERFPHGNLDPIRLAQLIDQHETAFLQNDRALEPEDQLAQLAAEIVSPGYGAIDVIAAIATDWARLRRGEPVTHSLERVSVPSVIRPALAHFRLRQAWSSGRKPGAFGTRLCILRAVLSGVI